MKYALALVALTAAAGCSTPSASESKGSTDSHLLGGGSALSEEQVADYLRQAGFPEDAVGKMVCTAKYESSFNPSASNGSHYGLFQIAKAHLGESGCPSSVSQLSDPETNCQCAFSVYQSQGMGAWTAYTSHQSECDAYQAPGGSAADGSNVNPSQQLADNGSGAASGSGCQGTDGSTVGDGACVQTDQYGWVQCYQGQWYQGADGTQGPVGQCTDSSGSGADDGSSDAFAH